MLTVGAFSVLDRDGLIVSSVCSVKYGDGYVMHAVYCRVGMVNVCSMKCVMFQRAYSAASCSVSLGKDG